MNGITAKVTTRPQPLFVLGYWRLNDGRPQLVMLGELGEPVHALAAAVHFRSRQAAAQSPLRSPGDRARPVNLGRLLTKPQAA